MKSYQVTEFGKPLELSQWEPSSHDNISSRLATFRKWNMSPRTYLKPGNGVRVIRKIVRKVQLYLCTMSGTVQHDNILL